MQAVFEVLPGALAIFFLRLLSMAVSSVRLILVARSISGWAALLGFFESLAFVVAIGIVAKDFESLPDLAANSLGFVAGTVIGMRAEGQLGLGYITLHAFTRRSHDVAARLYESGFPATLVPGQGRSGPVDAVIAVIPRRDAQHVIDVIESVDVETFVQMDEVGALSAPRRTVLGG